MSKLYEFFVAPPKRSEPLIKMKVQARNYYEAKQQAEAIYGKNCERSPIVPKK